MSIFEQQGGDKLKAFRDTLKGKNKPEEGHDLEATGEISENEAGRLQNELGDHLKSLEEKLQNAESEAKKLKEDYVRMLAETENRRKRLEREKDETVQYANQKLIQEFFPILDNLEMTLSHAPQNGEEKDPLIEGIKLVVKQFNQTFEKHGVTLIREANVPFDPNIHEAIGTDPTSDLPDDHVTQIHRSGFKLHGRLVRPAMVTVSKK